MGLFNRIRKSLSRKRTNYPDAVFALEIYGDEVAVSIHGSDIAIGGAMATIMSRNPYIYHLINNATITADKLKHEEQVEAERFSVVSLN